MTVTVKFPAALEADLRRYAEASGMTTSMVVREAVAHYLVQSQAAQVQPSAAMLGDDLFGRFDGPPDLAADRKAAWATLLAERQAARASGPAASGTPQAPGRRRAPR